MLTFWLRAFPVQTALATTYSTLHSYHNNMTFKRPALPLWPLLKPCAPRGAQTEKSHQTSSDVCRCSSVICYAKQFWEQMWAWEHNQLSDNAKNLCDHQTERGQKLSKGNSRTRSWTLPNVPAERRLWFPPPLLKNPACYSNGRQLSDQPFTGNEMCVAEIARSEWNVEALQRLMGSDRGQATTI